MALDIDENKDLRVIYGKKVARKEIIINFLRLDKTTLREIAQVTKVDLATVKEIQKEINHN